MKRKILSRKIVCVFFLLLAAVLMASAQSGRTVKKTPLPTPPPPPATPTPKPTPKPEEVIPKVKLRVVADIPLMVFQQFSRPENIPLWVVQRLENSPLIQIKSNVTGTQKKAKEIAVSAAPDEHVVYIQFNVNSTFSGGGARTNEGDVWIEYAVLLPQTGKSKLRDRVFVRGGSVSQSRRACYPSMQYADYMLLNASLEVAGNIMAKFDLPTPPEKCGNTFANLLMIGEPSAVQTGIIN